MFETDRINDHHATVTNNCKHEMFFGVVDFKIVDNIIIIKGVCFQLQFQYYTIMYDNEIEYKDDKLLICYQIINLKKITYRIIQ